MTLSLRLVLAGAAVAALLLAGCNRSGSADEAGGGGQPNVVMSVTAAKVRTAPMREDIRLLGTTVAMRHLQLRAPAAGRVVGFNLQPGDRVMRGQVVARLVNREVEAAASGLAVARQIDPTDFPAMARSVKRNSQGSGIAVISPADAIVSQRIVSSGQLVSDSEALADLIDPKSMYVEAAVPLDQIAAIKPGMNATVTSPLEPGIDLPARVVALSPSFTQGAATSPARLQFTGERGICQAGAPVEIRVTLKAVPDATVIPAAALFEDAANNSFYVFVAGPDGKAHRTTVRIGIRNSNEVQTVSGLTPGQVVITSGGYALSDGLNVKVTVAKS